MFDLYILSKNNIRQVIRRHQWKVVFPGKSVAGIDKVRELFKQQRIFINPKCVNLIWELETYSYPERKPDNNEPEKPIKENDHAVDALRYALYSNKPIIQNQFNTNIVKQFIWRKYLRLSMMK